MASVGAASGVVVEALRAHPMLASVLRGARNGIYYGTKIRLPHALVMTMLFRRGSVREALNAAAWLTFQHARNLGAFVGLYKALLAGGRWAWEAAGVLPAGGAAAGAGAPATAWHAALAGGIGGYVIWGRYSSVNFQIVLYLFSRVVMGVCKLAAARGLVPFSLTTFAGAYPWLAAATWAAVMVLFEFHRSTLHESLAVSMDFLYTDSRKWSSLRDFLPHPVTGAVVAYVALWLLRSGKSLRQLWVM